MLDPDPSAREWLREILAKAGYAVSTSPGDAGRVDLVIASLALSDEAWKAVRAMQSGIPRLRLIATAEGSRAPGRPASLTALQAADLLGPKPS